MDRHGFLTKAILFVALAIFLSLLWTVLAQAGVRTMLAIAWVLCAACFLLWLVSIVGWIAHRKGRVFLIAALALAVMGTLASQNIVQEVIVYCGDGVCAPGECVSGCIADCDAATCVDGICEPELETCRMQDCACEDGLACVPGLDGTDARGCIPPVCGDGRCDALVETPRTCCTDCGCEAAYACEQNICYFQPPRITFTPYIAGERFSATTLAANPMLTDERGLPHPLILMVLRNDVSAAGYTTVTLSLDGFAQREVQLGTLPAGSVRNITWYVPRDARFLDVQRTTRTNLTVTIAYADAQGVAHTSTWHYPFTILPRQTLDAYGSIVFFVTPADVPVEARTPHAIWDELRDSIRVEQAADTQFPAETLAQGRGSQRDIALVLASAFVGAGLKTSLVETEQGVLVRVREENRYVMLDPSVSGAYEDAIVQRPGYAVYEINETWAQRNATILSLQT